MQLFFLLLRFPFYSSYTKKQFLKRTTEATKEQSVYHQKKPTRETEVVTREVFVWQFYFTLSNVSIYDTSIKQEIGKFVVLAVHHVPSDHRATVASKILVLRERIFWYIFFGNYIEISKKSWDKSIANKCSFLNVNTGFAKADVLFSLNSNTYKKGFLSFKTNKFVCWLYEHRNLFDVQTFSHEWKRWRKHRLATFTTRLDNTPCFFRLSFSTICCESFFLINQSVSVLNSHNGQFNSTLMGKTCVRVDEERFSELQSFIESFGIVQLSQ